MNNVQAIIKSKKNPAWCKVKTLIYLVRKGNMDKASMSAVITFLKGVGLTLATAEEMVAEEEKLIRELEKNPGDVHIYSPSSKVYSYNTDVLKIIPTKIEPNQLYFGLELEHKGYYNLSSRLYDSADIYPYAILKEDSTVDLELVSIPMKWEQWIYNIQYLAQWIAASEGDEETGMHVHVSRSSFRSDEAACRFIELWGYMAQDSRWWGVLGREPNSYCEPVDLCTVLLGEKYVHVREKKSMEGVVKTLEIRLFRQTNCPSTLLKRLKLIKLTHAYVHEVNEINYDQFCKWYRSLYK